MAGRAVHLRQARANLAHAENLLRDSGDDLTAVQWAVTAAFYCALHCVEAHLAGRGFHSQSHFDRERLMREPRAAIPRDVRTRYAQLKDWSEQARYYCRQFPPSMVREVVLDQYLAVVRKLAKL